MVVVVPQAISPEELSITTAFRDFLDLRTAVVEYVKRPDIADVFPRLLAMAESRLNRDLRMREQMTTTTLSLIDGVVDLPDDFAEMLGVFNGTGQEYVQQSLQHIASRSSCNYSIEGGQIVAPLIGGDLTVSYYAKIPPLAETLTTTNWLLERYPDVYLYGVGFEASKYVRDSDLAQASKFMLDDSISTAMADDTRARFSRTRVRVAGVTP